MSKTEEKRLNIFKAYSKQWEILKQSNLLLGFNQKYVGNYICPTCLEHFSPKDLNQNLKNPLTLEDAPPKSLGGKANILTCKRCNNTFGKEIDFHLTERLREIDSKAFLPHTDAKVKIKKGDKTLQGNLLVGEDGTINVHHSKRNNHVEKLEEYIDEVEAETLIELEFPKSRVDAERFQYAILKTAYLLVFEKFGYSFILDTSYDRVREQLLNPKKNIYPTSFWFMPPYPEEACGVHFITEKGLESIIVIFPLKTKSSKKIFAAILPLPSISIDEILKRIDKRFEEDKTFYLELYKFDENVNYLKDIKDIKHLLKWVDEIKVNDSR